MYKGKPSKPLPTHLARSCRPVNVRSNVSGTISGMATDCPSADPKLTSTYTPATLAYHPSHSALSLALAACAISDWDESDAYLRVLRR